MKRKAHIVLWSARMGGMEKVALNEVEGLADYYNFHIFSLRPVPDRELFIRSNKLNITYGSYNNLLLYIKYLYYVFRNRKDIFHLQNAGPNILLLTQIAGAHNIIYHIHGTVYWKKSLQRFLRKLIWILSINRRITIISNTFYSRKVFMEKISAKTPVEVVYNPISIGSERKIRKKDIHTISICYVGRLSQEKNLFAWIDIADTISRVFTDISFHIYGIGDLEDDLKAYSRAISMDEKIFFEGFIEDAESIYPKHDILLFLSSNESFGNVVVESILSGVPVITSSIPSMVEIFMDYPEFLIDPSEDLGTQIIKKIEDITLLKDLAAQAYNSFYERYSRQNHLEKIKAIYEKF